METCQIEQHNQVMPDGPNGERHYCWKLAGLSAIRVCSIKCEEIREEALAPFMFPKNPCHWWDPHLPTPVAAASGGPPPGS